MALFKQKNDVATFVKRLGYFIPTSVANLIKQFTLVNYGRKLFIRLATGHSSRNESIMIGCCKLQCDKF